MSDYSPLMEVFDHFFTRYYNSFISNFLFFAENVIGTPNIKGAI